MNDPIIKKLNSLGKTVEKMAARMATKEDLKGLASKEDLRVALKEQKDSIVEEIAENINNFMQEVEEKKADRKDVEDLEKQVDKLERKIYQ